MGNYTYRAPEVLMGKRATAESDVYVLGLLAHEILGGASVARADGFAQEKESFLSAFSYRGSTDGR